MGLKSSAKGKAVAETQSSGDKRKRDSGEKGKSSGARRRTHPGVLRFFEDVAEDADGSDESDFIDDDFMDDVAEPGPKVTGEPGKSYSSPFIPKEEVMDEEEFDKMMEDRYKAGSTFVSYAEDYEDKNVNGTGFPMPTEKDPIIWKLKCSVGREKYLAFCLMQKFIDMKSIGTKLQIISAFTVEHVKGYIFIEADKQSDLTAACNGIGGVYASRVMAVPRDEVSRLFSIRSEYNAVTAGMWARVKNGTYKGDLGQVVAVNTSRKRATVKLIPRIDILALTEKFGEGRASTKRTSTPAPRLISASELEEFRPLIQSRQDRDTGKVFEVLDGMMFKDGFLFKKISIDSISCWGVVPTEEELLKFKTSENHESDNMEWLSQLYGEENKTKVTRDEGIPEKGESSSGSMAKKGFEVHDLVCFGRKDFGVIIGMEKDDTYKILKEGSEGPTVVNVQRRDLKSGPSNMKFAASDNRMKAIRVNDTVKVTEGPYEGKQGIVKLIYRGIIFLYDADEESNGGYFCCKSRICEKIKPFLGSSKEKGEESEAVTLDEFPPSPKSPLSPEKPFQARESNRNFNQGDEGNIYSIGQLLRIRVGPLKGYLCRVLAIRRSDVTVKLDSKQKILTVKSEHLSEVQKKNPIMSSDEPGSGSFKPSDFVTSDVGGSTPWMDGAGTSAANDGWNDKGVSNERSSWDNSFASPPGSNDEAKKVVDDGWGSQVTPKKNDVSWGAQGADNDLAGGWVKSTDSAAKSTDGGWAPKSGASDTWNKATDVSGDTQGLSGNAEDTWGKGKLEDGSASWDKVCNVNENQGSLKLSEDAWGKEKSTKNTVTANWGGTTTTNNNDDTWGKGTSVVEGGGAWDKKSVFGACEDESNTSAKPPRTSWDTGKQKASNDASSWGNASQSQDTTGWGKGSAGNSGPGGFGGNHESSRGKQDAGGKQDNKSESTGGNQDSAWGQKNDGGNQVSAWGNKSSSGNQESSWGNTSKGGNQDSAWGQKNNGGNQVSAWGNKSNSGNQESALGNTSKGGNQDSAWGNSKSRGTDGNENSTWGKISDGNSGSGEKDSAWESKSNQGTESGGNSAWGKKSDLNSESGGTSDNQDSSWGKKLNLNSDLGGTDGNQDSAWGKKSNMKSESGNGDQNSNWGGKSDWSSGSGQKSSWNSESGHANKNSGWGGKSDWSSGSGFKGSQSFDSGNDDQTEAPSGGGNWRGSRGSFRGRGGDRGGFGGRGSFGDRGGDRGGFGGRGGDREGFGGRGGDRGGFGGRGDRGGFGGRGDRGGYGGRGGDRGGFGGRGRSDSGEFGGRGGFGGRGRGRRDESGGWNGRDSGGSGSWRNNSGEENKNDGAGGWSQGGGYKKEWQSGSSGNGENRNSGGSWRQPEGGNSGSGWSSGHNSGGGWNNKDGGGGGWGSNSNTSGGSGDGGSKGTGGGGWGTTNNTSKSPGDGGGWGNTTNTSKSPGDGGGGGWGNTNITSKSPGDGGGGGWGNTTNTSKSPGDGVGGGWGNTNTSKSPGGGGGWGNDGKSGGASAGPNPSSEFGRCGDSKQGGTGRNIQGSDQNTGSGGGGGSWGNTNNTSKSPGGGGGWGNTNNTSKSPGDGGGGGWGNTTNTTKSPGAGGGGGWGNTNNTKSPGAGGGGGWGNTNNTTKSPGAGGGGWGNDGKSGGASAGPNPSSEFGRWGDSKPGGTGRNIQGSDQNTGSGGGGGSWGKDGKSTGAFGGANSSSHSGGWGSSKPGGGNSQAGGWGSSKPGGGNSQAGGGNNQGSDRNTGTGEAKQGNNGGESSGAWGQAADKSWGNSGGGASGSGSGKSGW